MLRIALGALIFVVIGGCASLPGQGPNVVAITLISEPTAGVHAERAFSLVELTPGVIGAVGAEAPVTIDSTFDAVAPEANVTQIGIGDRLTVRIWENSPDGLFSNAETKSSTFLAVVSQSGQIYVPYVGALYVVGLSLESVRQRIADGLEGRAVDPEVIVLLGENGAQSIAVVGDTRSPGRFDIPASGLRLLDAVALAGGAREASFNTKVTISRGSNVARLRLDQVMENASNNVWLASGDMIQLLYDPRSFTAFGAVSASRQRTFTVQSVNLAEALAQVGGLDNNWADEGGVFVFRFEPTTDERVETSGNIREYQQGIPTVYRLNFSTPQAFFLARSFMIRDKDILYVANAPAAEFRKFVTFIVSPFIASAGAARNLSE